MTSESRLKVGIVGAGPVGTILGKALAGAGHLIIGIHGTAPENLERAETVLPGVPVLSVADILAASDLVILAIPAAEIELAVRGWSELGLWRTGQMVMHTAAEHGVAVLAPAVARGVIPLAIHPAMRFTGTSLDLMQIRDAHFAITAPNIALPIAQALVIEMGGEPLVIAEENRAKYAEAIDVASSFSAMVVGQAIGILNEINVAGSREVLGPLVRSAVEQALAAGYKAPDFEEFTDGAGF